MPQSLGVRPLYMKKLLNLIWNPNKEIVEGFKYGTYLILAPILLLSFVTPFLMILCIYLIFFSVRTVVVLRAAATHEIDEEKRERYSGDKFVAKRVYTIFGFVLTFFIGFIIIFFIMTDGLLGLTITFLIALIILPGFVEEIVIIWRCQVDHVH